MHKIEYGFAEDTVVIFVGIRQIQVQHRFGVAAECFEFRFGAAHQHRAMTVHPQVVVVWIYTDMDLNAFLNCTVKRIAVKVTAITSATGSAVYTPTVWLAISCGMT